MLKIKSNTNEFTIIFFEQIGKKINAEKFSVPALSFFQLQHRTFLFFCFSPLCFFSVSALFVSFLFLCFSATFFLSSVSASSFFCSAPLFLFLQTCCPIFSAQNTFSALILFQPKNFFNPKRFSALLFFLKHLILFFLPTSKAKNILSSCFTSLLFE